MRSNPECNVFITGYRLNDHPASLTIDYKIHSQRFFSKITYNSINAWIDVQEQCSEQAFKQMIALIMAFDGMRFMSLGGEQLTLPDELPLPLAIKDEWTGLFRNVYGEWRYINAISYPSKSYPQLSCKTIDCLANIEDNDTVSESKILVSNGGGKDTLYSLLNLNLTNTQYDIYQAYLPLGGNISTQKYLLDRLRNKVAKETAELREVYIEDNFVNYPKSKLRFLDPDLKSNNIDFFVGHTANYVGLFPLIIQDHYTELKFNIEKTSDRIMLQWEHSEQDGELLIEDLNHQYCKSSIFREKVLYYFNLLFMNKNFHGFTSSLQNMNDTEIYKKIASMAPELIVFSHSCNINKPWCRKCPKCCFSYLMMCAYLSKALADTTFCCLDNEINLFTDPDNTVNWSALFNANEVAWECVAPTDECLEALSCLRNKYHLLEVEQLIAKLDL